MDARSPNGPVRTSDGVLAPTALASARAHAREEIERLERGPAPLSPLEDLAGLERESFLDGDPELQREFGPPSELERLERSRLELLAWYRDQSEHAEALLATASTCRNPNCRGCEGDARATLRELARLSAEHADDLKKLSLWGSNEGSQVEFSMGATVYRALACRLQGILDSEPPERTPERVKAASSGEESDEGVTQRALRAERRTQILERQQASSAKCALRAYRRPVPRPRARRHGGARHATKRQSGVSPPPDDPPGNRPSRRAYDRGLDRPLAAIEVVA